jgi:hypothetical protein
MKKLNKFIKTAIPLFFLAGALTFLDNATYKLPVTQAVEENFSIEMMSLVDEVLSREEEKRVAITNLLNLSGAVTGEYKINKVRFDTGNNFILFIAESDNYKCRGRFTLSSPILSSFVHCDNQ